MRIIAGVARGRRLAAPPGRATRPTADRVRQALFDALLHAPWAGPEAVEGARVLDAFAGSGALGLEALSRGAAHATFFETDRAAMAAIRVNIATCGVSECACALASDATRPPPAPAPCGLVFLDPPYGLGLVAAALAGLSLAGWLAPGALIIAETGSRESSPVTEPAWERRHGAARLTAWRLPVTPG